MTSNLNWDWLHREVTFIQRFKAGTVRAQSWTG